MTFSHFVSAQGKARERRQGVERGEIQSGGTFPGGTRSSRPPSWRDPLVTSARSEGPACRVLHFRRDVLVTSAAQRWIICSHFFGHDKRAPPNDFSEGRACHVRPLGGTRLSGPPLDVGSSIFFSRGLKSRAESGAKAPHSIWSAAIHRRFSVKALAFTTLPLTEFCRDRDKCALVGAIHELPLQRRRDVLVTSAVLRWIIPSHLAGHDKRAPPNDFSEGRACRVRPLGGTRLSGPPLDVGSSIFFSRGLKSRAESGAKAPHSIWSAAIHRRFSVKA